MTAADAARSLSDPRWAVILHGRGRRRGGAWIMDVIDRVVVAIYSQLRVRYHTVVY